jgi:hypothetical protein
MLHHAKLLSRVSEIVAVSGGSVLATHLELNWKRYTGDDAAFEKAAREVIAFTKLDIRNRILGRSIAWFLLRPLVKIAGFVSRLCRVVWKPENRAVKRQSGTCWGSPTFWLSWFYDKYLFSGSNPQRTKGRTRTLADLDPLAEDDLTFKLPPRIALLATGIKSGTLCSFTSSGLLVESTTNPADDMLLPATAYPLSLALAASSAFPVLFPPVRVNAEILNVAGLAQYIDDEYLSDGGVFDNSGIRRLVWMAKKAQPFLSFDGVIVSDAGAPFKVEYKKDFGGLVRLLMRAPEVLMRRVADLEDEVTGNGVLDFGAPSIQVPLIRIAITKCIDYRPGLALLPGLQPHLAEMRTDFDGFTTSEIRSLVIHGYAVARSEMVAFYRRSGESGSVAAGFHQATRHSWDPVAADDGEDLTLTRAEPFVLDLARAKQRAAVTGCFFKAWETWAFTVPLLLFMMIGIPWIVLMYRHRADVSASRASERGMSTAQAMALLSEVANQSPAKPDGAPPGTFGHGWDLSGVGIFRVEYLDDAGMDQVIESTKNRSSAHKKERLKSCANKQLVGKVSIYSGKWQDLRLGFPVGEDVPGVGILGRVNGIRLDLDPQPVSISFVGTVDEAALQLYAIQMREKGTERQPFPPKFSIMSSLKYDGERMKIEGSFVDPDIDARIGTLFITWRKFEELTVSGFVD